MDHRKVRRSLVLAFAGIAIGAGFVFGAAANSPVRADEVIWTRSVSHHQVPVQQGTTAPAPTYTTFEVIWT